MTEEDDEGQGFERVTMLPDSVPLAQEQIDRLLGRAWPDAKDGRTALLVCAECFSLGCGAITALVVFSRDTVEWRDLGYEFPWDDTPTVFEDPPVSFTFDRRQYEDLLAELRARFDPSEGDGSPPPGGPPPGGPPPGGPPPGGPPPGGPAPGGPAPSEGSNRPAPRG